VKTKMMAVLSGILSLGAAGVASAADMAVKAPPVVAPIAVYNWTGFYIGVNGGYGWNESQDVGVTGSAVVLISQPGTVPFRVPGLKPEGGLVGGTVGYNWQFGRGVAGIEADFDWADISDSRVVDLPLVGPTVRTSASQKIDFFGTVRGRLGFLATDQLLLFATGGLAYANVKNFANINEFFNAPVLGRQFIAGSDEIRYGWTIGGGAEWKFAPNWSVKGEYLWYDLGGQTIRGIQTNPANGVDFALYSFNTRGSIARAGINYQFGGPVVAKY
jgi:outer membrane immunogenic protein